MATHNLPSRPEDGTTPLRKRDKLCSFFKSNSKKDALNAQGWSTLQAPSPGLLKPQASSAASPSGASQNASKNSIENQPPEENSPQLNDRVPQGLQPPDSPQETDTLQIVEENQSKELWERAFWALKARQPILIEEYEKQLASMAVLNGAGPPVPQKLGPALIETIVKQKLDEREAERLVFQVGKMDIKIRAIGEKIIKTILWAKYLYWSSFELSTLCLAGMVRGLHPSATNVKQFDAERCHG